VAVSRGLLAPANFLIHVMRGVPTKKKKKKKKKKDDDVMEDVHGSREALQAMRQTVVVCVVR